MPVIAAYIGLGSNMESVLGDPSAHLAVARRALAALPGVTLGAVSGVYRTEPQGNKNQPWFYNQVLRLDCAPFLTADALFGYTQEVENNMGRQRDLSDRFGPRIIDIDLLLFGEEIRPPEKDPHLVLPHPRLAERAFVLAPLHEVAPKLTLPDGQSVEDLLRVLPHNVEGDRIFQ